MANSQNLLTLSNAQLESQLKASVADELKLKVQILHLLAEVERRRLYSKIYPSLFEYCTRELRYSAASAQRRIDTMRAMKLMPEIEEKIQSGILQISNVAKAQSFFRQESRAGKSYSLEAKREVLAKIENKSSRECEMALVAISPQSAKPDVRREICADKTELRVTLTDDLIKKLDHLKSLLSNKYPHLNDAELIDVLADMAIKRLDPCQKTVKPATPQVPAPEVNVKKTEPTRYIPATIKHYIWMRDKGRCTHAGCDSRHKLQYDHIKPLAKGGETSALNLRLLCQTHNLLAAGREFGEKKISGYHDAKNQY